MSVQDFYKKGTSLTAEQIARIEAAKALPTNPDSDCPEYTYEELKAMYQNLRSVEKRQKQTVSLRLDAESIELAKSFGNKYTTILGLIIYRALRDPAFMKKIADEYYSD